MIPIECQVFFAVLAYFSGEKQKAAGQIYLHIIPCTGEYIGSAQTNPRRRHSSVQRLIV